MNSTTILIIILSYFVLLMLISHFAGRKSTDNEAFFLGNRQSPWWLVAIGMIGASVSGVSFISVPGMVGNMQFTYMQTVIGFFFGYIVVAHVLLPLYYKLNLTSIYSYLGERFGKVSYKTGSSFFLLSKTIGAAVRLYIVALILQKLVADTWNIPFYITVSCILLLIWIYTFRSGIKSIVYTDTLQTIVMIAVLIIMIIKLMSFSSWNIQSLTNELINNELSNIFVFKDWVSKQHFVKQFISGIFIVIVMTGLDQDMMQKNLSCRSLKVAQKNMYWYGFAFIPVNLLFLILGFMIMWFAVQNQLILPVKGDEILPFFASNYVGGSFMLLFVLGIIAAAFSSADSALTALTTSFLVDILEIDIKSTAKDKKKHAKRTRISVHAGITLIFFFIILLFEKLNNTSVIDAIYIIVSYTYGPLLGMFAFGLFTKLKPLEKSVPFIAILSPLICYFLNQFTIKTLGYAFGYELLLLNGALTFIGLLISTRYGNKNCRICNQ